MRTSRRARRFGPGETPVTMRCGRAPYWRNRRFCSKGAQRARTPRDVGASATTSMETDVLKFYFNGSPNPTKVALFLEEAGIAYEPIAIDTRKGEQFNPDYLAINPNG